VSTDIEPVIEGVAGIILAGGASRRMGQPKLLLPWQGEPLVRRVAHTALQAGLKPTLVVAGAYAAEIQAALSDLAVEVVPNPDWEAGQSASVRAGVQKLAADTRAAVFLLGDQPQVPPELVVALVQAYARTRAAVVAPLIAGQRGNPVLFDRAAFPDLLELSGDAGGRQIFDRYPPLLVPWTGSGSFLDIDTPADYRRLVDGP
jgi:molybdenum cofactor cytidylyltransferase